MRHLPALLLLGAIGCHLPATLEAQPLRANVWFDEYRGVASFDISRPAHVAIFALRPLGRIEMIYPGWNSGLGMDRPFRTGQHSVRVQSRMYQLVRGRRHGHSRYRTSGQTYILMIASDRPLYLDDFFANGTLPWLNHPSVTWNPFLATDHLAREIVPGQGRSEWTAAYHVIWPEASLRRYDGRIPVTRVRCPGGVVVSIATQVFRSGRWTCPDRSRRPPEAARPRAPRVPPVTGALPKRPRPTGWGGATPTRGRGQGDIDGRRARPRPDAKPGATSRPGTVTNVIPRRRPAPRPNVRPKPNVRPRPIVRPKPAARPNVRPKPAAKPKVKPKPKAVPKVKPKPKKKGGG